MDDRLKPPASQATSAASDLAPGLPPRTEAQFLAQLPELAEALLDLSQEYESSLQGLSRTLRTADSMRGWTVLETLARESLMERARHAAQKRTEDSRAQAVAQAQVERPNVPRRTMESALKSQAMKALNDPGVLNALKQWTHSRNTRKT